MKFFGKTVLFAAAFLSMSACSESGSGNATVSFEKDSYTFAENAGSVSVPLVFTGEPAEYPIILNIGVSAEGETPIDEIVHFVQQIGSLRYNGKGELAVEMEIMDNFNPNNDVVLSLDILSADGAEIVGRHTDITITDNDASLFTSLQGMWMFYAMQNNSIPVSFEVGIDAGETSADEAENEQIQRLRVLGFGGYYYTESEEPFQWFLDIVTDEITGKQSLRTVPNTYLVRDSGSVLEVSDGDAEKYENAAITIYFCPESDTENIDPEFAITADISEDGNEITFDSEGVILPYFWLRGTEPYGAMWGEFHSCRMERM